MTGMGGEYGAIYRRVTAFIAAMPLISALPLAVQLLQRGLIAADLVLMSQAEAFRISMDVLNTLAMLIVSTFAMRWWRFGGDRARVWRIGPRVVLGAVAMIVIQLVDQYLFTRAGHLAADLAGGGRGLFVPIALVMWLFVSVPLYPWYVALLSDDGSLGFRQAVAAVRPFWLRGFLLVFGAILPLILLGSALRVAMIARFAAGGPVAWLLQIAQMLLVPVLIVTTASAYFAIYRRVRPGNFSPD
jgi:hypothetical protein